MALSNGDASLRGDVRGSDQVAERDLVAVVNRRLARPPRAAANAAEGALAEAGSSCVGMAKPPPRTLPVRWDGVAQPRGIDWALSNGTAGEPTTLCAVVAGVVPAYRGQGLGGVVIGRMVGLAAGHGFDSVLAPVRPNRKENYPLIPIERYIMWRREDGYMYDPWLRTHERLGGELLEPAPRSLTVTGSREEWEGWTDLQFPEDGDYIVPGALVPVSFKDGVGTYTEPNVWMRHPV